MRTSDGGPFALIDTHAHLEDRALRADLDGALARARDAGVVQVIAIGTTADDSACVGSLAASYAGVFAAVGVHPNHVADAKPGDWERVVELARRPKVVALGETGLDRYRDHTPFADQQAWFNKHLVLAHEYNLPVVIHCRESERDIITQLERLGRPVRGVLHSFTGTWDDAEAFLQLGLYLSFAGMVTFTNKNLDSLRTVAARVPLDRLLVETDSPYLSPHPHRGATNEPSRVVLTAARLAEVRNLSLNEVARVTSENAQKLFDLPLDDHLATPSAPHL